MIRGRRRTALAVAAVLALPACDRTARAPGMDGKDLSDDRGARAGRFPSPVDNGTDANDVAAPDNITKESMP